MTETPRNLSSGVQGRSARSLGAPVESVILVLTIACGLATWAVGLGTSGYDYDEVMRADSIWLAAQGLRPYRDFLECHPPYFALLSPVVWIYPDDPCALLWSLRMLSATGNLLFLGGLAALGASSVASGRLWARLGLTVVAFQPAILQFLVEFRIDGWGYALAVWSIYRFRRLPRGDYRNFELGVLTGIASLLFCPKLALLPPLIILFEQLVTWESVRGGVRAAVAYIAGAGVGAGLFALYLIWQRIDLDRTWEMLVHYNAITNTSLSNRLSLLTSIVTIGALFWVILAGLIAWAVDHVRHRSRPDAYEAALAVWLVVQALLVGYPYKQYYAPWFLFASAFLVYLGRGLSDLLGCAGVVVVVIACAMTVLADYRAARTWSHFGEARTHNRLIRWMNRVTRREDRVVASHPLHPVDRYDGFFVSFNNYDPRGFDTESILAQMPMFQEHVTAGRFGKELEDHPPALVVLSGDWRMVPYTSGQRIALSDFLRRHGYRSVQVQNARFALRPDRLEQARRAGLLDVGVEPLVAPPG